MKGKPNRPMKHMSDYWIGMARTIATIGREIFNPIRQRIRAWL